MDSAFVAVTVSATRTAYRWWKRRDEFKPHVRKVRNRVGSVLVRTGVICFVSGLILVIGSPLMALPGSGATVLGALKFGFVFWGLSVVFLWLSGRVGISHETTPTDTGSE